MSTKTVGWTIALSNVLVWILAIVLFWNGAMSSEEMIVAVIMGIVSFLVSLAVSLIFTRG